MGERPGIGHTIALPRRLRAYPPALAVVYAGASSRSAGDSLRSLEG